MGFLKSLFSSSSAVSAGAPLAYIVDGVGLGQSGGNRSKLSPGDQLQIIRKLGRVASREKLKLIVGFDSQPLRKVGHGKSLDGIQIFFSNGNAGYGDMLAGIYKKNKRSGNVLMITSDADIEDQVLSIGGSTMRISTFSKSVDGGSSSGGGGGGGGRSSRNREQRGRRSNRPPRQPRNNAPKGEREQKSTDTVGELIDLID